MPKGSELFLVDSSGWIEFLGDGPLANRFAPYFEREERLIVPAIVLYEVYKKLLSVQGSTASRQVSFRCVARPRRADRRTAGPARGADQPGPAAGHGRRHDLRNRFSDRGAARHFRRTFQRLARSDSLLSQAVSVFLTKQRPAYSYFPTTSTTNVSGRTLSCVAPWPCLAVTTRTLCVFMSTVMVRAPDCVSSSSSTLKLSGESS